MTIFTNYWYLWPLAVVAWLALGWAEFGWVEGHALVSKDANKPTLFVYTIFTKFPLSVIVVGLAIGYFAGVLSTHFLWHWCPPGSVSAG